MENTKDTQSPGSVRKFEVWIEGYRATGQYQDAHKIGEVEASNFDEACIKLAGTQLDKNADGTYRRLNKGNYCIWACALYDNEKEARAGFG